MQLSIIGCGVDVSLFVTVQVQVELHRYVCAFLFLLCAQSVGDWPVSSPLQSRESGMHARKCSLKDHRHGCSFFLAEEIVE